MPSRGSQDIVAGLLMIAAGAAIALYALNSYNLGTLRRMGPGMFPFGVGVILAGLGVLILLPALLRGGERLPEFSLRKSAALLAGVAAFALSIRTLGMIPAIVLLTVISSLADSKLRPLGVVVLSAALCLLAWGVFRAGLGLNIPLWRWPF